MQQLPAMRFHRIATEKFKTSLISVNFLVPLCAETASEYTLVLALLKRACAKYPTSLQISEKLDDLYGADCGARSRKKGECHLLGLSIECISGVFAPGGRNALDVAELLCELLFRPLLPDGRFDPELVRVEKERLCETLRAEKNDKAGWSVQRCMELMCEDEPYAVNPRGDLKHIAAATPESLAAAWRRLLTKAPVEAFFVGPAEEADSVLDKLSDEFSAIERHPAPLPETPLIAAPAGPPREFVETLPTAQSKLVIGFRCGINGGDPDGWALTLFNMLYGGSPVSRLFRNVREKLSLCYYCSSRPEKHKGLLIVSAGIERTAREKAQQAILAELGCMQRGEFTDEELEAARIELINILKAYGDDAHVMEDWRLAQLLSHRTDTPEDAIRAAERLGREDVVRVARRVVLDTVYFLESSGGEASDNEGI